MIKKILTLGLILFSSSIYSQAGTLDSTFGTSGKVLTNLSSNNEEGRGVAIQADGKIVVAGYASVTNGYDFAVLRYNTDGTIDTTFGNSGVVTLNVSNYDLAYAVKISADNKIYVAGVVGATSYYGGGNLGVVRLNTDGTIDTTFGTNGAASVGFPGTDYFTSMTLQNDGKILLCGYTVLDVTGNYSDYSIARFNTDGTLDFDFSNDGKTTVDFNSDDRPRAINVDNDGNIYLGGSGSSSICIAKFFSDGTLNSSYGTSGKVNMKYNNLTSNLNDMALLSDGSIIFTGYLYDSEYQMFLGKIDPNGAFDTTFGTNGGTVTDVDNNSEDTAYSMNIQSDGKILISGRCYTSGNYYFAVLRYTSNGVLDNSFSNDGKVLTAFGTSWSMGYASALQSDQKLIVVGTYASFNTNIAIARYNTSAPLSNIDFERNKITVFPNPTDGLLNISSGEDLIGQEYFINDNMGRRIGKGIINYTNTNISVENKQSGLYFITIPNKSISLKFIKN